jgi:hypothetical protein
MKRTKIIKPARPNELTALWGRADRYSEPDVCYAWGDGVPRCDSRLIHNILSSERVVLDLCGGYTFEPSLLDELEKRGYDLTTLKFSISKKT